MSYSKTVLDHFQNPRNLGELPNAHAEAKVEHPVCGDIMKLAVKVLEGRIEEVRYRSRGCVASIAAGSCLTELIRGKAMAEVRVLRREQLLESLGGLSEASTHATYLAMDALSAVLRQLEKADTKA